MRSASGQQVDVVYVGGSMRSGSTLLDRMLSRVPGFVSVGEVVHLWERGVRRNELCGCGVPFHECGFWARVGKLAFGGWNELDVHRVLELQRSVDRTRFILRMVTAGDRTGFRRTMNRYGHVLRLLYQGISAASGGCVVVDSSKHASTAFLLRDVPGIRLHVIHLVRDSHGVAFSLTRQVRRPEVTSLTTAYMPTATPVRSGLEWLVVNGLFHALRAGGTPTTFLTYESLVGDPEAQILRIAGALGKQANVPGAGWLDGGVVQLGRDHTVSGNPMRFFVGDVALHADDAWRRNMRPTDRAVTTALTWPLLMRYRYPLGSRR